MATAAQGGPAHCPPQAQAPPHPHPPAEFELSLAAPVAKSENRRFTRSLPQEGHASAVATDTVIERCSSNSRSHRMQTYS